MNHLRSIHITLRLWALIQAAKKLQPSSILSLLAEKAPLFAVTLSLLSYYLANTTLELSFLPSFLPSFFSKKKKGHPLTGRTHQIRVHLQYLGFPIANDPIYTNPVFGPNLAKGGVPQEEFKRIVLEFRKKRQMIDPRLSTPIRNSEDVWEIPPEIFQKMQENKLDEEPRPQDLLIFLHSFRYKG